MSHQTFTSHLSLVSMPVDNQHTPPAERSANGTLVHLPARISFVYGGQRFITNFLARNFWSVFNGAGSVWKSVWCTSCFVRVRTEEVPTGEEGLHGGTLSQLDRRLSRVSGQSRVCAVVQEQPDYWKVVARYGVVERPEEREKRAI